MGEMADYHLDEVLDHEETISDFRRGLISMQDAFDLGLINEHGGEIGTEAQPKTCRCCGTTGLSWGKHNEKWRLFDNGKIHVCPVKPLEDL